MSLIGSVLSAKQFSEEPQKDSVLSRAKKDFKYRMKRAKFRYKDSLEGNKKENIEKERETADKWLMDSGKRTGHSDSRQTIYYEGGPKTIEDPKRYEFEKEQLERLENRNEREAIKYAKSLERRERHPHLSALGSAISSLKEKTHSDSKGKDATVAGGIAATGIGASVLAKPAMDKISRFNYDRRLKKIEADWAEKTRKVKNQKLTSPTPTSSSTDLAQFNNLEIEKINREREMRRLSAAKKYEKGLNRGLKAKKLRNIGIAASALAGLGIYLGKRKKEKSFADLEKEEERLKKKERVRKNNKKAINVANGLVAGTIGGTALAAGGIAKDELRSKITNLKIKKDINDIGRQADRMQKGFDKNSEALNKFKEEVQKRKAKVLEELEKKGASKKQLRDIGDLIDLKETVERLKFITKGSNNVIEEAEKWKDKQHNDHILAADKLYKKKAKKINKRTALITAGVTAPFVAAGLVKRYKTDKKLKDDRKQLEEKKAQQGK